MSKPENQQPSIELDRLALIIGHKEITIALQQDQINALLSQLGALRQQANSAVGPREVPDA